MVIQNPGKSYSIKGKVTQEEKDNKTVYNFTIDDYLYQVSCKHLITKISFLLLVSLIYY